ncbi:MAG: hypothetical protein ACUVWP_08540 [bacterium]
MKKQFLIKQEGKFYDRIDLGFSDEIEKTVYFDIPSFFGKDLSL